MGNMQTNFESDPKPLPATEQSLGSVCNSTTPAIQGAEHSQTSRPAPFHDGALAELSTLATPPGGDSKGQRTSRLMASCSEIATNARCIAADMQTNLEQITPLPTAGSVTLTTDQAFALLHAEIETENKVNASLEAFSRLVSRLENEVIRGGFREYQSSTGLLDDHPRLSAAICAGLGIATLSMGIYAAVVAHAPLHHATEAIVGALFGHGLVGSIASVFAIPTSLFFLGIPVLGSSIVGPLAFGALKVLGGKITRGISPDARNRFDEERHNADLLRGTIATTTRSLLDDINRIRPLFERFMDRNEVLRDLASSSLSNVPNEADNHAAIDELAGLNRTLGAGEATSGIRLLKLERSLRQFKEIDFRSPELRGDIESEPSNRAGGFLGKISRGFGLALYALRNFAAASQGVGTKTALNTADDLHQACDHMPKGALDPLTATGSSVGTTLHIALETGAQPEKAVLDALKGMLGLVKSSVAGGVPKGPSSAALVRVLLELEEIERGNRVRWFVKLGPSIAFALLKKPALVLKAQKLEESSGKITVEMFEGDHAKSKGRLYSAWKSTKEIASLAYDLAREGGYRWLVELPLRHIRDGGTPLLYLSNFKYTEAPMARFSLYCGDFLETLDVKHQRHLESLMNDCVSRIPAGQELVEMDSEALTRYAVRTYFDYRYNEDSTVSEEEINSVLAYWRLRDTSAWYREKRRVDNFRKELAEIDPRLLSLNDILHGGKNLRSVFTSTVDVAVRIGSKLKDPTSNLNHDASTNARERLNRFVGKWNQGELLARASNTILDCGPKGAPLVVLTTDGRLELLEGAAGRLRLIGAAIAQSLTIAPNADHVRVAATELYLSTTLESYQREALLRAHSRLTSNPAARDEAVQDLVSHSFSRGQLEGLATSAEKVTPGLLGTGIIGATVAGARNT